MLFVPVEAVAWWAGLAVLPAVAWWRRWRVALLLSGAAVAAGGIAYYRLVMAHRPAGYYALFEAWAGTGLVLVGVGLAFAGVVRLWRGAQRPAEPGTASDRGGT